jgi:2-amino-4-hydroxy-6-hydroxymethyldihydropteridine diphosphokinase
VSADAEAVYLGLGANLGNRAENLRMALRYVSSLARVDAVSSLYETAPVGSNGSPEASQGQPSFYNAVCRIATGLSPEALLDYLKSVEFEIGRRPAPHWAARPVDLDILLYEERVVETDRLVVPHPWLAERAFVLVPLAEIAPDVRHPVLGRTVSEMLASLGEPELAGVTKVEPPGWERDTKT